MRLVGYYIAAPATNFVVGLAVVQILFGVQAQANTDYITAYKSIQADFVWPVPGVPLVNISDTFSPRIQFGCKCYDFHRGIDIPGDIGLDIVAPYDGTVVRQFNTTSGGNQVILEHSFPAGLGSVYLHPDKDPATVWYTQFLHMNETLVAENDVVVAGDTLGKLGDTGVTDFPHLHYELRFGTRCSLSFAIENPTSTCNTFEFDPHIHPLLGHSDPNAPFFVTVATEQAITTSQDGIVSFETPDYQATLNKYQVQLLDGTNLLKQQVLDLNLRTGYDATGANSLDVKDTSKPYLDPISFGEAADTWKIHLVVPASWASAYPTSTVDITVWDIWGNQVQHTLREGTTSAPTKAPVPSPPTQSPASNPSSPTMAPTSEGVCCKMLAKVRQFFGFKRQIEPEQSNRSFD